MNDDKFTDDFLKELEEASNNLKEEFTNTKEKKTILPSEPNIQNNHKAHQINHSLNDASVFDTDVKKFQDLLGNLMKGINVDQGSEELNSFDKHKLFEQLNNEINDLEKKIQNIETGKINTNSNTNSQHNESKTIVDAFKQISDTNKSGDEFKGLFEGLGNNFQDLLGNLGSNETKNVSDLMGILNTINENDVKESGDGKMSEIFDQLFDVLLKDDVLTVPLSTIKKKLEEYNVKNKGKISEEEIKKYEEINKYIDEVLVEIKKEKPNKEYVIQIFEKLHLIGELPAEIMNDNDENMNMLNFATNFFKK